MDARHGHPRCGEVAAGARNPRLAARVGATQVGFGNFDSGLGCADDGAHLPKEGLCHAKAARHLPHHLPRVHAGVYRLGGAGPVDDCQHHVAGQRAAGGAQRRVFDVRPDGHCAVGVCGRHAAGVGARHVLRLAVPVWRVSGAVELFGQGRGAKAEAISPHGRCRPEKRQVRRAGGDCGRGDHRWPVGRQDGRNRALQNLHQHGLPA